MAATQCNALPTYQLLPNVTHCPLTSCRGFTTRLGFLYVFCSASLWFFKGQSHVVFLTATVDSEFLEGLEAQALASVLLSGWTKHEFLTDERGPAERARGWLQCGTAASKWPPCARHQGERRQWELVLADGETQGISILKEKHTVKFSHWANRS